MRTSIFYFSFLYNMSTGSISYYYCFIGTSCQQTLKLSLSLLDNKCCWSGLARGHFLYNPLYKIYDAQIKNVGRYAFSLKKKLNKFLYKHGYQKVEITSLRTLTFTPLSPISYFRLLKACIAILFFKFSNIIKHLCHHHWLLI